MPSLLLREDDQRAWAPLLCRQAERDGAVEPQKRRHQGELIAAFQYLKGASNKPGGRFLQDHTEIGWGGIALNSKR